jgi:hypothetical protein
LTASKLGTDIPAEQSLSPGEEIVKWMEFNNGFT